MESIWLPSILNMLWQRKARHHEHIKTLIERGQTRVMGQKQLRRTPNPLLLTIRQRKRDSLFARPVLHFRINNKPTFPGNQVDFTGPVSVTQGEDAIAFGNQDGGGDPFGPAAAPFRSALIGGALVDQGSFCAEDRRICAARTDDSVRGTRGRSRHIPSFRSEEISRRALDKSRAVDYI